MMAAAVFFGGVAGLVLWAVALRLSPGPHGRAVADLAPAVHLMAAMVLVLLSAGGAGAVIGFSAGPWATAGFAVVAAVAPGLAFIDWFTERLPFAVTVSVGGVASLAFGVDAIASGDVGRVVRAAVAAAVIAALSLVAALLPGPGDEGAVGGGDIVLAVVVAGTLGWLGWPAVWVGFTFAFVLLPVAVFAARVWPGRGRIETRGYVPLGPYLLAGWWGAIALAATDLI